MVAQNTLRTWDVKQAVFVKSLRFPPAVDVIKCLEEIKEQELIRASAHIS